MSTPEKRPAFEPAEKLLAPPRYDPTMTRPASTTAGALLVLLRVAVGVLQCIELVAQWVANPNDANLDLDGVDASPDLLRAGIIGFLVLAGIVLAVEALLAVLIYRGRNVPRVIVMVFSVLSISAAFVGWWSEGQDITLRTSLPSLALDILVLLALSSRSAAAYARSRTPR